MASDLCVEYTLGSSGLVLNDAPPATGVFAQLKTTEILGIDGRPIRATILPNGAADGGDKLTARFGPRLIRVNGDIVVFENGEILGPTSPAKTTTYLTAVNTLINAWIAGLEALLNTTFALTWTPTGAAGRSLTCTYGYEGQEFQPSGDGMTEPRKVTFGLVAETG
jgi:hypothetical protein